MFKGTPFQPALALAVTLLMFSSSGLAATMYKWTDSEGNVHYSQTPPAGGKAQKITPPPAPSSTLPPEQAAPAPTAAPTPDKAAVAVEDKKREAEVARLNCEAARKNLEVYTSTRRLLTKEGEAIILDDDMRAAKIQEAQDNIKKYCE